MSDSSEIDAALIAKLLADATLTALLPDGWYIDEAKPGATRFGILSLVDEQDEPVFGKRAWEDALYLVKAVVLSSTGGDVKAAAARIDTLLEHGTLSPIIGYRLLHMIRESRLRITEVDEVDASIRWQHRGGHYRVQCTPCPILVGVYAGGGMVAAPLQFASVACWYDAALMIRGSDPITVVARSSNVGLHPDLTLTLDVGNSSLVADPSQYVYGRGQLIFDLSPVDLTGCSGVTFEISDSSTRTGWLQVLDHFGGSIQDSLGSFDKFLTVP